MGNVMVHKDHQNNDIRNARMQPVATDPSGLGTNNSGRTWFNTAEGRYKVWNGAAADLLSNVIESVVPADAAVTAVLAGKTVTIGVASASGSQRGTQSPAHFSLLDGASASNGASTLVRRDASGNFSAGTITAGLNGPVTLLGNPSGALEAVPKQYADAISAAAEKTANKSVTGTLVPNGYAGVDSSGRVSSNLLYAATTSSAGVITLAGDLGGTGGNPTVPGLATKAPIASPTFTGTVTLPADPTIPLGAATKQYVDNVATGLDTKASAVYGTTAALPSNVYANGTAGQGATLTASANGALTVDGQTPAVNNRVLVKNEATAANNGLYVVTQVGSGSQPWILTRTSDADQSAEVTGGMFVFIEAGNTLGGTGWVLTGTGTWTIGTTAQTFTQFTGGAAYTAGNGLGLAANQFSVLGTAGRITVGATVDIASTYAGQGSITTLGTITTGAWQGSTVGVGYGGTGATTAAAAKTNLGFATGNASDIPAGTSFTWTHNLGTVDIVVMIVEKATGNVVEADITGITTTQLVVSFGSAVAANAYRVVAIGR